MPNHINPHTHKKRERRSRLVWQEINKCVLGSCSKRISSIRTRLSSFLTTAWNYIHTTIPFRHLQCTVMSLTSQEKSRAQHRRTGWQYFTKKNKQGDSEHAPLTFISYWTKKRSAPHDIWTGNPGLYQTTAFLHLRCALAGEVSISLTLLHCWEVQPGTIPSPNWLQGGSLVSPFPL